MGGNIFKNKATSISIENIQPTIDAYKQRLGEIFPMNGMKFIKKYIKEQEPPLIICVK